ncbi:MAG: hypothetical protein OSB65_04315 [Roseibacillus sp.]|jgi:hypothetical protein|nr:hypothetical protein [Roseibacillus sp.]
MKRITCRLAQRTITPAGLLANHVGRCEECQSYFDRVRSLEEDLRTPPEKPDEELAQSIMAMIEGGEQGPAVKRAFTIPIRRWVVASGLAATAAVILALLILNKSDEPTEMVTDPPPIPVQPLVPPTPQGAPVREQTLAYVVRQQELLQRDFQKLGAHLRENLILFRPRD